MTIWKFPLEITDFNRIKMPGGAKLLSVQDQAGTVCVWALVDPGAKYIERVFRIFGTGQPIEDSDLRGFQYLGTVVRALGALVWHVYAAKDELN